MTTYTVQWPESPRDANGCLPRYVERPSNHDWRESEPFGTYAWAETFALKKVFALGESGQTWASLVVRIVADGAVVAVAKSVLWEGDWADRGCAHCGSTHKYRLAAGWSPHFTRPK